MFVIKIILKIACIPVLIILSLIQWFMIFINAMSAFIFYFLSGVLFFTAVLSYGFQLEPGSECLRMIVVGFLVFLVPIVGCWIASVLGAFRLILGDFMWS